MEKKTVANWAREWARDIASFVGVIFLTLTRMLGSWVMAADQVVRVQIVCTVWGFLMILLIMKIGTMCGTSFAGEVVKWILFLPICLLFALPLAILSVTVQRHVRIERIEPASLCTNEPPASDSIPSAAVASKPAAAEPVAASPQESLRVVLVAQSGVTEQDTVAQVGLTEPSQPSAAA